MRPATKRTIGIAVVVLSTAIALIGVLHAPFARSLLMRAGGCPMAGARMTATEMDAARHLAANDRRGATFAPARPALGFTLDITTLADVHAWAASHRVVCEDPHAAVVVCTNVAAAALGLPVGEPVVDEITFGFNRRSVLVNATTFRSHLTAGDAASTARGIASSLLAILGPAERTTGAFDEAHLGRAPAQSIAALSYRYSDYIASVSAMNLPSGASVREQYMSAND